MGVTVIPRLLGLKDEKKIATTVGEARLSGINYRHPDSALVSYPVAAAAPLGTLPAGNYRIAIVGGGAGGIAALYELGRLAATLPAGSGIDVQIYEADPDSFLHDRPGIKAIKVRGLKAGRVSAALVHNGDPASGDTIYEVGAMRFPEIAGLTWHYASAAFGDAAPIKVFPNPGKVPTEFVFGNRVDRYVGSDPKDWEDPDSPTLKVLGVVAGGLVGNPEGENVAMYPIANVDPAKIAAILNAATPPADALERIQTKYWPEFIAQYDGLTLGAAVREIVTVAFEKGTLPPVDGVLDVDESISYYVELFGRFGFGTGGFKPLYNISLVEMMRLILWDYSNEYTLPVTENVEFIRNLFRKAQDVGAGKLAVQVRQERVANACHSGTASARAQLLSYDSHNAVHSEAYDFVILAVPHDQLTPIVSRSGFEHAASQNLGDAGLGLETHTYNQVYPPLLLSDSSPAANARIVTAIGQLHMARSSKVFATVKTAALDQPWVPQWRGEPIKAVVSDSGLAASYVVPSPIVEDGQAPEYSSLLASYTWEDDSTRLQHDFGLYPQNPATETGTADGMYRTMVNRAYRYVKYAGASNAQPWWFYRLLAEARTADRFVFDWTTNKTAGGFKLDMTGDHHQSNLCFRYHTHALAASLDNRFFIASDSYSHLGGWLEGAFMSALNAVAGLIVRANRGDVSALSTEARPLVIGLRPVVKVPAAELATSQ